MGVDRLIKKEVLGWAHSHLTISLNLEPDTSSISLETCSKYNEKIELTSVLKSGLYFALTFIFLTSKEKQILTRARGKDELLLLLHLHATTSTYYFSFYYFV